MDYRRIGERIVVSLKPGEELCSALLALARKENLKFALVSAHGSCSAVKLGIYHRQTGRTVTTEYTADEFEIASVTGELTGGNDPALNLHAVIGNPRLSAVPNFYSGVTYSGTLESAYVLAGCTAVLDVLELDAHMVEAPEAEKSRGLKAALSRENESSRRYRTLELDLEKV